MNYANCSPLARGVHAFRRSAVIKHDVDYCDSECGSQEFPPKSLRECTVLRMGTACRKDLGAKVLIMGTACHEDSGSKLCHSFSQPLHLPLNRRDVSISLASLYQFRCAHIHMFISPPRYMQQINKLCSSRGGFLGNWNLSWLRPCTHTHSHMQTYTHIRTHTHFMCFCCSSHYVL